MPKQDIFDQIAKAKMTAGGNWIKPGDYTMVVRRIFMEQKRSGLLFIAEMRVVASSPGSSRDSNGNVFAPNKVGEDVGYIVNLTGNVEQGPANVKGYVAGLLGMTEQEIDTADEKTPGEFADTMRDLCNEVPGAKSEHDGSEYRVQPAKGLLIGCRTFEKVNQGRRNKANEGKIMIFPNFYFVESTPEETAARRADMERKAA